MELIWIPHFWVAETETMNLPANNLHGSTDHSEMDVM